MFSETQHGVKHGILCFHEHTVFESICFLFIICQSGVRHEESADFFSASWENFWHFAFPNVILCEIAEGDLSQPLPTPSPIDTVPVSAFLYHAVSAKPVDPGHVKKIKITLISKAFRRSIFSLLGC